MPAGTLLLGIFLLLPVSPAAQEIRPGALLEREIAAGAAHTFTLPLEGHRFARLEVKQRDVDVVVAVYRADGSLLTEVNKPGEWRVEESVPLLTEEPETLRVEVRALPGGADPGHYGIRLEEVRDPKPGDAPRIAAEREEAAADRLAQKRTEESYRRALQTYRSALERWRTLGDEPRQAEVLLQTGSVRRLVGDPAGALEDRQPGLAPRSAACSMLFPEELSVKEVTALLSAVGFSSPPAWLRPFGVLSTGQQFRVTLARLLAKALARAGAQLGPSSC